MVSGSSGIHMHILCHSIFKIYPVLFQRITLLGDKNRNCSVMIILPERGEVFAGQVFCGG